MTSYKVTYEDYAGKSRAETVYFNINETELHQLNARYGGSLTETLARIAQTESPKETMDLLMDILRTAYGRMDDDRVHFRKSDEIWEDWVSTPCFDKFFMDVLTDDKKTAEFIKGVLPKRVRAAVEDRTESDDTPKLDDFMRNPPPDVTIS